MNTLFCVSNDVHKQDSIGGVKYDLQHGIYDDENGTVFTITTGQLIPHHDHGNATSEADKNHACPVRRQVGERGPCETEHNKRSDDPV